jgi:hypothetical protein
VWRRTHMIHANPANPRVATTRLLMSRGNTTAMVRTGLFMNEDGNVFSACMTREEELGRLLGGRKNEPLVPPAFITSAVLKVSLSHSAVVRMRAKARLLCKSNQVALPRIGIPPCPGAVEARGSTETARCLRPGRVYRAKPGTPGRSARYPSIRHESGTRPVPTPLVSSHRRSRQCQHYAMPL